MCMLVNDFSPSKSASEAPRNNITMYLKPNKEKECYRFRLLNFRAPEKSKRDQPFIARWVHQHWTKDEKGRNITDDTVTCITTPKPQVEYTGNRYADCPLCKKANENYGLLVRSGWKDKIARENKKLLQRTFQGIIPVYVVNDPNNEKNNGRIKCFIINERAPKKPKPGEFGNNHVGITYQDFVRIVETEFNAAQALNGTDQAYNVFNGKNAKDIYIRVDDVEQVFNEGKPNEFRSKKRCITRAVFGKTAYDIPGINKEALDDFPFDDTYFTSSTIQELEAFYNRHFRKAGNSPDEDVDLFGDEEPSSPEATIADVSNTVTSAPPAEDIPDAGEIDDLTKDPEDIDDEVDTVAAETPSETPVSLQDIDTILGQIKDK